jgi:hypothetical protein
VIFEKIGFKYVQLGYKSGNCICEKLPIHKNYSNVNVFYRRDIE